MASQYTREQILDIVERQAQASGIPREDFLRFAYIETGGRFNPDASNPSGAKGLFQFMPGTAAQYGIAGSEFDPAESTRAAAALYRDNRTSASFWSWKSLSYQKDGGTQAHRHGSITPPRSWSDGGTRA